MLNYNTSNFRTDTRQEIWFSIRKKINVCFKEEINEIQNGHHVGKSGKTKSGNVYNLNNEYYCKLL